MSKWGVAEIRWRGSDVVEPVYFYGWRDTQEIAWKECQLRAELKLPVVGTDIVYVVMNEYTYQKHLDNKTHFEDRSGPQWQLPLTLLSSQPILVNLS